MCTWREGGEGGYERGAKERHDIYSLPHTLKHTHAHKRSHMHTISYFSSRAIAHAENTKHTHTHTNTHTHTLVFTWREGGRVNERKGLYFHSLTCICTLIIQQRERECERERGKRTDSHKGKALVRSPTR